MPNWNYNSVTITAPMHEVKSYFIERPNTNEPPYYMHYFNMHKLFPDKFPLEDQNGSINWDYNWYCENTGSKWAPMVPLVRGDSDDETVLTYDTARAPNNGTLERLHQLTGWTIVNEYEEPLGKVEGTFECVDCICSDDEREYMSHCEVCERRKALDCCDDDAEDVICEQCWNEHRGGD